MRLAAKLVSLVLALIVAVLAVDGYLSVRRETRLFRTDMKRDAHLLGSVLRDVIDHRWKAEGQQAGLEMVQEANDKASPVRIRWVWLDTPDDTPDAPLVPRQRLGPAESGHDMSIEWDRPDGETCLFTYCPVDVDPTRAGALELSEPMAELHQYTSTTIERTAIVVCVTMLLSAPAVALLGMRMIGRPLRQLIEKTRRVGSGDLAEPIALRGHDELSEVSDAMNEMCIQLAEAQDRIQAEHAAKVAALEQLRHEDRLRTIGRLASGIAHELGTPLNVMSGRASLIARGNLSEKEATESASIIKAQTDRIAAIIRHLLDFARRRAPERTTVDLPQIVKRVTELLSPIAHKHNATIAASEETARAIVKADAGQIQQVLTNLVINGVQAMPNGGHVRIAIRREHTRPPEDDTRPLGKYICISVADEGSGIPEERMPHLFEPFYTTKGAGEGTGLGLSIVYEIVREHEGWIRVTSEVGKGSCFLVYLPMEAEECTDTSTASD